MILNILRQHTRRRFRSFTKHYKIKTFVKLLHFTAYSLQLFVIVIIFSLFFILRQLLSHGQKMQPYINH